jgi:hypothetical protein
MADLSKSIVHINQALALTAGITGFSSYAVAVDLPSLASASSDTVSVTVTGVALADIVLGVVPTTALTVGYHVLGAFVSAADTVQLFIRNDSASTIDPTSQTFTFIVADRT